MTKSKTLNYLFGEKHVDYMRRCRSATINVAEGAVRAGKTVDNVFAFAYELESTPDRIHLATGSTIANAKLNIGDCNGYGLEGIFRGRCKWGKYKDNECLRVKTPTGIKIIIFAGGAKADSYKKIRGNSYGMWIATEINLHHDTTIKEAFNRQLAAKCIKVFWDLNPDNPNAPIYVDYIDKYRDMQAEGSLLGGYNYEHFTIHDNATITPESLAQTLSRYVKGTIWYRRDIDGERCIAEGLIYQQFADNPDNYIKRFSSEEERREYFGDVEFGTVGIDFGGNRSLTTFTAVVFHRRFEKITAVADHHIKGRKGDIDADVLNREFVGFVQRIMTEFPNVYWKYAFADNEAQYLINTIRKAADHAGLSIEVADARKELITQRIYCTNTLLNTGKLFLLESCPLVAGGLKFASWDPKAKKDKRLDNFSSDIDILDSFEYTFEVYIHKLLPER